MTNMIAGLNVLKRGPADATTNRPPVLLVHGAWHGAWCWEGNYLDWFAERGHPTWALDLRGHGQSPARRAMRWNRLRHYTDDVAAVVSDMPAAPVVIGHSMGGLIAQHLLSRDVAVRGVGLLASAPHYGVIGATWAVMRERPLDFLRANLELSLYPLVRDPHKAAQMFLDPDTDPETAQAFGQRLGDESYLGFLEMLGLDLPRRPRHGVPACVVGAELDGLFPPTSQQRLARRYQADCHIIAGAAHDLMLSEHWRAGAGHFATWIDTI